MTDPTAPDAPDAPDDAVSMDVAERQTWLSFLAVTQGLIPLLDAHHKREFGTSQLEHSVMIILGDADDNATDISDLARRLETSLSRMSHTVRRLRDDGLVELATSTKDRRATVARLTPAGSAHLARAFLPARDEIRRLLLEPLTADQRAQLRSISLTLLAAWRPDDRSPWVP